MVQQKKKSKNDDKEDIPSSPQPTRGVGRTYQAQNTFEILDKVVKEVEDYAMILLDQNGIVRTWNRGAERLKGYAAAEMIGKSYKSFYSREDRHAKVPESLITEARKSGRASHEGWRIRKDGSRFWGSITITALHGGDESISGFLKVTRDLTEKKIAEEKLQNLVEELRQKNQDLKASEQRYHMMIAEVEDYAIILVGRDGKIQDWNKGAEKLKGYKAAEIKGKHIRLFYPMEDKEAGLPENLLAHATESGSVRHEGWRLRKDGRRFWASDVITALHDDSGHIIGFSNVTRDLTEWKASEDRLNAFTEELKQKNEDLHASELRYQRMIAEVQDYAIILLDEEGYVRNWNVGAARIKGYRADEVVGKHFSVFYTENDARDKLPERLLSHARRNGRVSHEGWRLRKDGARFWGSVVITALHDPDGHVIGFSKVTRDLTERKLAEDNLKANAAQLDLKNQALERLNAELSSFTYVASHDLNEPLRKILVFADRMLQRNLCTGTDRDDLEKIHESAARMQKLIKDLLAYSSVSTTEADFEVTDLNKVLENVKSDLDVAITQKDVVIHAAPLPIIQAIPFQIHQLFMNLIGNAIKFSKPGLPPVIRIEYKTIKVPELPIAIPKTRSKYHHLVFSDNGIGFETKYANKIFEPFQRLHDKSSFSGTGIGLAIVKKIVDNHGGIISAEGAPDEGATFNVYLPC